ncbi:MAG: hypothetical protein GY795_06135, partial [Desulfobacterales bacterium]|nr:hypothetical protein [Desulfobacterales bacterium]
MKIEEQPSIFIDSQANGQQVILLKLLPIQFHRRPKRSLEQFQQFPTETENIIYRKILDTNVLLCNIGLRKKCILKSCEKSSQMILRNWTSFGSYFRLLSDQFWFSQDSAVKRTMEMDTSLEDKEYGNIPSYLTCRIVQFQRGLPDAVLMEEKQIFIEGKPVALKLSKHYQQLNLVESLMVYPLESFVAQEIESFVAQGLPFMASRNCPVLANLSVVLYSMQIRKFKDSIYDVVFGDGTIPVVIPLPYRIVNKSDDSDTVLSSESADGATGSSMVWNEIQSMDRSEGNFQSSTSMKRSKDAIVPSLSALLNRPFTSLDQELFNQCYWIASYYQIQLDVISIIFWEGFQEKFLFFLTILHGVCSEWIQGKKDYRI